MLVLGALVTTAAGVQGAMGQDQAESTPIPMTLPRSANPNSELKKGEGRDLVQNNCLTCHTTSPIITHDGFTPEVWESEVHKMRETYGAQISDEDAAGIVTYLSTYYSNDPGSTRDMLLHGIGVSAATPGVSPATPQASPEAIPNEQPSD